MPVHYMLPFRSDKNLGLAYNEAMALIPDGHHACFRDIDTMFLTPNTPRLIEHYVSQYPDAVLTCYTNRISELSRKQLWMQNLSNNTDILHHIDLAESMEGNLTASEIRGCFSGFLMVIPKAVWLKLPFKETGECLGIDTDFSKRLLANNVPIVRMNAVYVFHIYRLKRGIKDKTHLQ